MDLYQGEQEPKSLRVTEESVRLDVFLKKHFEGASRSAIAEAISRGQVRVEGSPASKGIRLREGQEVLVEARSFRRNAIWKGLNGATPRIVHVSENLLGVCKPAGIPCHPQRHGEEGTLIQLLTGDFPKLALVRPGDFDGALLNRIDTLTSGLVLVARSEDAHRKIKDVQREGGIRKTYLAVAWGIIEEEGVIEVPLVPAGAGARTLRPARGSGETGALRATTKWKRLAVSETRMQSLVTVEIVHGVRHQIRAHFAAMDHALVGDSLYGGRDDELGRQALHSLCAEFVDPFTCHRTRISAPPRDEFAELVNRRFPDAKYV